MATPVAPRAGAWIETRCILTRLRDSSFSKSPPVRGRGLKLLIVHEAANAGKPASPPVRGRGLKQPT